MDNQEKPTPEEELEDLLYELFELDFNNEAAINRIEADVLPFLSQKANHICALIVLMFIEIMRGNRYKAQSLANKIWEIGGELPSFFEMIYIENLLSLGLIDMAMVLLKPRFESLAANIDDFYSVLLKFSVMTGNVGLLRRIAEFPQAAQNDADLFAFANEFVRIGKSDVFKNLQKIILDAQSETLCAYEYQLHEYLEILLYINAEEQRCRTVAEQINQKLRAYFISSTQGLEAPIKVSVKTIQTHEPWLPDEE